MTTPYRFRIERVEFLDKTSAEMPDLCVFVGPNDAGKTRLLREIAHRISSNVLTEEIFSVQTLRFPDPISGDRFQAAYPHRQASEIAREVFGREVRLDVSVPQWLRLCVAPDFDRVNTDPRAARREWANRMSRRAGPGRSRRPVRYGGLIASSLKGRLDG